MGYADSRVERLLDGIERLGNRLPDPVSLFALGLLLLMAVSALVAAGDLSVARPAPATETPYCQTDPARVRACSLLSGDGAWWLLSHLVDNFIGFAPLGVVLVGMLGIGLAERVGLLRAVIVGSLRGLPSVWLTPMVMLIGILSSLGLDAGYVVLPPLAAALYLHFGRSPVAGIATAFAGVSAGFSANLVVTALDPLLAGLTTESARLIDPAYEVAATANLWFMMASTPLLAGVGWWVARWLVEPRVPHGQGVGQGPSAEALTVAERRGLAAAALAFAGVLIAVVAMARIPDAPLWAGGGAARVIEVVVPLLMLAAALPALVYGVVAGTVRSDRDVARELGGVMSDLGPYIVLAFFAGQFIAAFRYTGLGEMLAILGGEALAGLELPLTAVVLGFVLVSAAANLLMGSASAKYALLAPVFVPLLMVGGISPELTQAGYRVGDSVTNVLTPFNPYMIIIIAQVKRFVPDAGLGTIVSMMLPFALAFLAAWGLLLGLWVALELPLGPGAPLTVR